MAIKAITFDLFGTLLSYPPDCQWIHKYATEVHAITRGEKPYRPIAEIFRDGGFALDDLKVRPGVAEALERLRANYVTALLSNAGSLAWDIGNRLGIRFTTFVEIQSIKAYKPDPRVYRRASEFLGFDSSEILHVASHKFDLNGAKEAGFRTAYLAWPGYAESPIVADEFDYAGETLAELEKVI